MNGLKNYKKSMAYLYIDYDPCRGKWPFIPIHSKGDIDNQTKDFLAVFKDGSAISSISNGEWHMVTTIGELKWLSKNQKSDGFTKAANTLHKWSLLPLEFPNPFYLAV